MFQHAKQMTELLPLNIDLNKVTFKTFFPSNKDIVFPP